MGRRFRFVHCADLHLGTPIADVAGQQVHWDGALREATIKTFAGIVDLAIEKRVQAIIIAGDVYNAADHSLAAQLEFSRELFRAASHGIKSFIAHGNHDPLEAWRAEVPLPPTAHVFRSDRVEGFPLTVDGELVAMVYGRSYGKRHEDAHWVPSFVRDADVPYAIGVLHTQGPEAGETGVYAPCTEAELIAAKMDYWALGHVHTRSLSEKGPVIAYPGSPQSLHRKEIGPRGCYLVEVGGYGTTMTEFYETDAVRREQWTFDVTEMETVEDLVAAISAYRKARREEVKKPILAALTIQGRGCLHPVFQDREAVMALLDRLNEAEYYKHIFVYCYELIAETSPVVDWGERRVLPDAVGDYLRTIDRLQAEGDAACVARLRQWLAARPEWERYARQFGEIDDERLLRIWKRIETTGAERILGACGNETD